MSNFPVILWREQAIFRWNDGDDVRFGLDQHWNKSPQVYMPHQLDTIILIPSQPLFALTLSVVLLAEKQQTPNL